MVCFDCVHCKVCSLYKKYNEPCDYYEGRKKEILDNEPIPKKKKFHISDMDIMFDKELTHEEMELRFFGALRNAGVIGHRGCPH